MRKPKLVRFDIEGAELTVRPLMSAFVRRVEGLH